MGVDTAEVGRMMLPIAFFILMGLAAMIAVFSHTYNDTLLERIALVAVSGGAFGEAHSLTNATDGFRAGLVFVIGALVWGASIYLKRPVFWESQP